MTLHFASGASLDQNNNFAAGADGFNLVDVQGVAEVNALPAGTQGLVWLDESSGVTQSFIDKVTPLIGNSKVFGFYLTDEPDPTGQWHPKVNASDLKAESDWIHANFPGAKTFITTMDMGSSAHPDYSNTYNYANTHIDLFGVAAYPVWSDTAGAPDYSIIDREYAAAVASGITPDRIVPEFQAFGGGGWVTENGTPYATPTASQEQAILDHWAKLTPNPVFDYTYAWGSQNSDTALAQSPALQQVFAAHNAATSATGTGSAGTGSTGTGSTVPPTTGTGSPPPTDPTPTPVATGTTPPPTDGSTTPPASTGRSGHHHWQGQSASFQGAQATQAFATQADTTTSVTASQSALGLTDTGTSLLSPHHHGG